MNKHIYLSLQIPSIMSWLYRNWEKKTCAIESERFLQLHNCYLQHRQSTTKSFFRQNLLPNRTPIVHLLWMKAFIISLVKRNCDTFVFSVIPWVAKDEAFKEISKIFTFLESQWISERDRERWKLQYSSRDFHRKNKRVQ
mgnify:CR=1 FL=1